MRVGIGCMRLSGARGDADRDEAGALATLRAAIEGGAVLLDTAHAYGLDDDDLGHNERLVGRAVRDAGAVDRIRIVTKCGMRRPGGAWVPDGRARALAEDVRASVDALGVPIDLLLLHAPDPRTPLATSVRALARAVEEGHARAIGLSNVTRAQLEEATAIANVAAVEVALGAHDDEAARGGLVRACAERGIEVLAHSPLGGPKRAHRLARDPALLAIAARLGATPAQVVLAYLLALHPVVVPIVGARRPESVASALAAEQVHLDARALEALDARFPGLSIVRAPPSPPATSDREVTMIMGVAGAGKSTIARTLEAAGEVRLNRDTLGGSLRGVVKRLDERLAAGDQRIVLDNTYLTRASRADVVLAAHRHGARVRCVFLDTRLADAQVNVVVRMLVRHGRLLDPDEIARAAKGDPGLVRPTVLFRMARELERPTLDEGFSEIDVVPFARAPRPGFERGGAAIALEALVCDLDALAPRGGADALEALPGPCLVFAWRPEADPGWIGRVSSRLAELSERTGRAIELGICPHPAGPPVCWCRPPLPGLWLAFAERHRLDTEQSVLVAASAAHETMARALGMRLVQGPSSAQTSGL